MFGGTLASQSHATEDICMACHAKRRSCKDPVRQAAFQCESSTEVPVHDCSGSRSRAQPSINTTLSIVSLQSSLQGKLGPKLTSVLASRGIQLGRLVCRKTRNSSEFGSMNTLTREKHTFQQLSTKQIQYFPTQINHCVRTMELISIFLTCLLLSPSFYLPLFSFLCIFEWIYHTHTHTRHVYIHECVSYIPLCACVYIYQHTCVGVFLATVESSLISYNYNNKHREDGSLLKPIRELNT